MVTIGIDPGSAGGAISKFENGRLTDVKDLPIREIRKPTRGSTIRDLIGGPAEHIRHEIDAGALAQILRSWTEGHSAVVYCEKVGPHPRQGLSTTSRFMTAFGVIQGVCAGLSLPIELVEPEVWQRATGTPSDNKGACQHAAVSFPAWKSHFKRTSVDHHKADSVMIGLFGTKHAQA